MRVRFNRWYNTLIASLLSMLGFDSCSNVTDAYEYGAPYATYQIRGTVTDEEGNPIPGIKGWLGVVITNPDVSSTLYVAHGDSAVTDSEGHLIIDNISERTHYLVPGRTVVELKDEDGEANGGDFSADTLNFDDMKKTQLEKGDGWYQGKFEYSFTQKLNKKK